MKDLIYFMIGKDPSPQGAGDTRSWFYHYKLRLDEEELYVPVQHEQLVADWEAGDRLWFVLDYKVVAVAPILRVEEDPLNQRSEVWYVGSKLIELDQVFDEAMQTRIVDGDLWKELCRGSRSSRPPAGT